MNPTDLKDFQLINAASGDVNLVYKGIHLHCNNNPQIEALKEFEKLQNPGPKSIVVIMGLGLGYLLKRVFLHSKCKIVVYEPNKDILNFTRQAVDFNGELQSGRVSFVSSMEELNEALSQMYSYKDNITLLKLKSADLLYPEPVQNLLIELPAISSGLESNFTTLFKYSTVWFRNSLLKFEPEKPDFSLNILKDKFRNKAAIIVSAGPSLDKTIEILKNNRDKFIIFCVNVAYKRLISAGITPDFTLYIDAHNYLYTIKDFDHSKTNIITHSTAFFKIFDELKPANFFTFYCKNDLFSRWIAQISDFSLENYETKGSVSHLALLTAANMGCNPIILTGQDLAYSGGKYYSSGSFWSEGNENKEIFDKKMTGLQRKARLKVKGQNGELLDTSPDYAGFIKHFEEFASLNTSKNLINCSPGGAQINGFENRDLKEIITGLPLLNLNISETLDEISGSEPDPVRENYPKIREQLKLFSSDFRKALTISEKGLKSVQNLEQELKKPRLNTTKVSQLVNQAIASFSELENNLFKKWDFSMYLAFQELIEFYALMDNGDSQNDQTLIFELAKATKPLFQKVTNRLKDLNEKILPQILE